MPPGIHRGHILVGRHAYAFGYVRPLTARRVALNHLERDGFIIRWFTTVPAAWSPETAVDMFLADGGEVFVEDMP